MNTSTERDAAALLAYVPPSAKRVLDCGCGDGARARVLRERGAEVVGLETDAALAAQAASVMNRVFNNDPQTMEWPFPDGYFDCILCDDLLAQMRDPKPLLTQLARMTSPHGLLVLTFPNLRYYKQVVMLAEGGWTYADRGALAHNHLRFFTAPEMIRLLRHAGFEPRGAVALASEDPDRLPQDETGCVQIGRVTIGPLDEEEYKSFLTEEYVILSTKSRFA
jgi:2-polyprenyl-3-methyl-5-hydroxy-6-metoxy-1,4-benzoquinol methylase